MKRIAVFRLKNTLPLIILLLLISGEVANAYCAIDKRYSTTTYWTLCGMPSAFTPKARSAISTWDASDTYNYVEYPPNCAFKFVWGYKSFSSYGWGTVPGTTFLSWYQGKLDGAKSYYNSDKNWYDSGADGSYWSTGWYDRKTVALHETGHWMSLNHPSACGQNHPEAVMEPINQTKWSLRSDDLDGLSYLGVKK
jgi:hypothetical protein